MRISIRNYNDSNLLVVLNTYCLSVIYMFICLETVKLSVGKNKTGLGVTLTKVFAPNNLGINRSTIGLQNIVTFLPSKNVFLYEFDHCKPK